MIVAGPNAFQASLAASLGNGASSWTETGTEAELQLRLPAGTWSSQFHLVFTNEDTFVGFFPFNLASNLPPVPEVLNLAAAQTVDAATAFTLSWTPWIATAAHDRLGLQVRNAAGQVVDSAASDCRRHRRAGSGLDRDPRRHADRRHRLHGLPHLRRHLLAAQDDGTLMVERGYQSRTTRFPLVTAPGSGGGQPGDLLNPTISGTNLVFTVKGTPGTTYAVESTSDLATWVREQTVTLPASGLAEVSLPLSPTGEPRFYRATSLGGTTQPPGPADARHRLCQPRPASPHGHRHRGRGLRDRVLRYSRYLDETGGSHHPRRGHVGDDHRPHSGRDAIPRLPRDRHRRDQRTAGQSPADPRNRLRHALRNDTRQRHQPVRGATNRVYTLEQSTNLLTWSETSHTIQTDAQGKGRVAIEVAPDRSVSPDVDPLIPGGRGALRTAPIPSALFKSRPGRVPRARRSAIPWRRSAEPQRRTPIGPRLLHTPSGLRRSHRRFQITSRKTSGCGRGSPPR